MKQFNDDNFVLETQVAQDLYHNHAAKMPIIDYHCHLIPEMVANDHRFKSITELWLGGDHYKWRAMRTNGIDEKYCTGKDTSDWEKFEKWAETVPYTFRNPLYHWTHLELKTAFGIEKQLSPKTAREIFDECNEKLKQPEYSARGLMKHYNVECVCTTDDPVDDLHNHIEYAKHKAADDPIMIPAWRPDKAMNIEKPEFSKYVEQLAQVSGVNIVKFADMVDALQKRHDFFQEQGCKLSDHGISMMRSIPILRSRPSSRRQCVASSSLTSRSVSIRTASSPLWQRWMLMLTGHSSSTMVQSATTTQKCTISLVPTLVSTLLVSSIPQRQCPSSSTS